MDERKSYAALVERLVEDGGRVRRLWSPEVRVLIWLGMIALALGGLMTHVGWPFVSGSGRAPSLAWEVIAAAVVATVWATLALRTAVPGREPSRAAIMIAAALVTTLAVFWLDRPSPQLAASVSTFISSGIPCTILTVVFSLLTWTPLLWAVRRGAPLAARRAAILTGGAGFLAGYLVMRFVCHLDEPAHLLAWHALPVPIGTAAIAAASARYLARWRSGRPFPRP